MLSVLNCLRECEIAVLARRHLAALPAPYDLDGGSRLLAPDWYFTGIDIASFTVEGEHVAFSEAMVTKPDAPVLDIDDKSPAVDQADFVELSCHYRGMCCPAASSC